MSPALPPLWVLRELGENSNAGDVSGNCPRPHLFPAHVLKGAAKMAQLSLSLNGVSIWEFKDYGQPLMRITVEHNDNRTQQSVDMSPEQWRTLKNLMDCIEREPKIG